MSKGSEFFAVGGSLERRVRQIEDWAKRSTERPRQGGGGGTANESVGTPQGVHGDLLALDTDDHAQYVYLTPGSSARNLIQPTGDFINLTLKMSTGQTEAIFRIEDDAGNGLGAWFPTGLIVGADIISDNERMQVNFSPPDTSGIFDSVRTFIAASAPANSSADYNGLRGFAYTSTNVDYTGSLTGILMYANHVANGTLALGVGSDHSVNNLGGGLITKAIAASYQVNRGAFTGPVTDGYGIQIYSPGTPGAITTLQGINIQNQGGSHVTNAYGLTIDAQSGATGNNIAIQTGGGRHNLGDAVFITREDALTAATADLLELAHNSTGTPAAGFGSRVLWRLESSTTPGREALDVTTTWGTATDGSRKARAIANIWDTAAREALRLEASGSAAMIGFLGAAAAAQQTGGAATAGATYTATEQTMLQKAYNCLRVFGFLS